MKLIIYFIYSHPKIMQKKIPLINVKRQKRKRKKEKKKKGLHLYESVVGVYIQPGNPTTRTNPIRTIRVGLGWISISGRVGFIFLNPN